MERIVDDAAHRSGRGPPTSLALTPHSPLPHPPSPQGITKDTIAGFCSPHIDVVSMGSLTQGYSCADFSLKIAKRAGVDAISRTLGGAAGAGGK